GTTLGRFWTTCGLAPPRPVIPPGIPPPPIPPIGIGIGMPPAPVAAVSGAAASPDIAELAIRAGIDPAQSAGTESAPTNRASPRPAETPAPPVAFTSGRAPPTNF